MILRLCLLCLLVLAAGSTDISCDSDVHTSLIQTKVSMDFVKNASIRTLAQDEGERILLEAQERSILDSLGDTLPFDLLDLGLHFFGSGENLKRVVSATHAVQATIFGIGVTLRMLQ